MNHRPRKGLPDIRILSNQTSEAQNPQRRFLRVAHLELRKTLCNKVRTAAVQRVAEMDKQLAEIAHEQVRLLEAVRDWAPERPLPIPAPHASSDAAPAKPCGFTVKY